MPPVVYDIHSQLVTGIPQGSTASPILFTIYLSGLFSCVEEKADVKGLSFVAWLAEGKTEEEICDNLQTAALFAQQ